MTESQASAQPDRGVGPVLRSSERAGDRPIARVLLDTALPQLDHLFDYAIPPELAHELCFGHRVRVPFRSQNRKSHGYVIEFAEQSDFGGELAAIAEIVGGVAPLTPEVWRLARAVADRAAGSACDILRLALPGRMVRVERDFLAGKRVDDADLPYDGDEGERATAKRLIGGARLASTVSHAPIRLPTGEWVGRWADQIARTALAVHAEDRSVIIAVPDYRDIDQVRDALHAHGHRSTVRVDARQSNGERYASFLRALEAKPRIILGNRSAVYAPAHALGAIMLWDDGDPLLAEPLSPYVHARDAALVRASQTDAGLLFAAHMQSAEVQRLIELAYVAQPEDPPRRIRVVHADADAHAEDFAGRLPEFAARTIRDGLREGPVLVQVAAPGFAKGAACADCDEPATCAACRGPISFQVHREGACDWCGRSATAHACGACGGRRLALRGVGSRFTAEVFERKFRDTRVIVSDGQHARERVDARAAIVIATRGAEPIAAGGYRRVILLDAERLLSRETLRAGEDLLRWWENACALAAPDGLCVVASGGGPVVRAFLTANTQRWLRSELQDRIALRYPPAVRVASVVGGSAQVAEALDTLAGLDGVDVLGPAALPPEEGSDDTRAGRMRAIVRFDYGRGAEVAKRLRGALVADAAGTARSRGRAPARSRSGALRLRFDDRGVFDGDQI